jgi:AraC family transcriptional activator FtrA
VAQKTITVNIMPRAQKQFGTLRTPHRVVALAYDGLCTFEFGIAVEMFGLPRPELDRFYDFAVCGVEQRPLRAMGGVSVVPTAGLRALQHADTIIIPGWPKPLEPPPAALVRALVKAHERGARIVSICVGSFVLGATGLLDGREATTHWQFVDQMRRDFPRVRLLPDVLYVDGGDVMTSAGSAAGIDLCLHIIRKDFGTVAANVVARRAVVAPHREGGQAQFVDRPVGDEAQPWLSNLREWVQLKLHKRISVDQLAREAHTSKRTLSRRFAESTGMSPLQWINTLRVRRAKDLLETTTLSVEEVAEQCGFDSAAVLRHHFRQRVQLSPNEYRSTFRRDLAD